MRVATYVSFFFLVDVAAVFFAAVFRAVVFAVVGFLVAVVFFAAVVFFWAVVFAAVGFFVTVGFFATVFRGVVFAAVGDVAVVGSLVASTSGSWAAPFFVEVLFFPFTFATPVAGRPSHAGRVPIAQASGFWAWW
jgi:hypothetical protein